MSIKEFELFHGACLTRLVRRDKPTTLRLIETDAAQSWSTYRVNDVAIFMKHCTKPRELKNGGRSWSFPFGDNQLQTIKDGCHVALICGSESIKDKNMEICFIEQRIISNLLSGISKSVSVSLAPNQSFRVSSSSVKDKLVVSRSAIDQFEVPA